MSLPEGTQIPCVRPDCGHDVITEHSSDASPDGVTAPCMICGCVDAAFDAEGFLESLR
jgi:hypothetical protein